MTRAKLSGALLVRKGPPAGISLPQDLSPIGSDADEQGASRPVLVWSARPDDAAEPNPAIGALDAAQRAVAPGLRWSISRAVAVAVSFFAIGSVSAFLLLQPSPGTRPAEAALSVAPSTPATKLASSGVELQPQPQPPAKAASAVASPSALDSPPENAPPAVATLQVPPPDNPATGAADIGQVVAPTDAAVVAGDPTLPVGQGSGAPPSAIVTVSTGNSSTAPAEAPGSAVLNAALVERGDALFVTGDLSSARMFYERAAGAGHGPAALRLGETYDPAFLARTRFIGARANAATAAHWYRRAHELGIPEADILLKAIAAETGRSTP
jgi:hypothetical protein